MSAMMAASDIQKRLHAFHWRNLEYLRFGLDRIAAARFVVEAARSLYSPALDVGTGKGLLAIQLARAGMEVVTVDVDDEEQRLARLLAEEAGEYRMSLYRTHERLFSRCRRFDQG